MRPPAPLVTPPAPLRRTLVSLLVGLAAVAAGCSFSTSADDDEGASDVDTETTVSAEGDPDCPEIVVATSPEKLDLVSDLAATFNEEPPEGVCANVNVRRLSSGAGMATLAEGWDPEVDGPEPVIWSPASSAWGQVLNFRREADGLAPMVSPDAPAFMLTPLVIAMPQPMADALGYPETPVGWSDVLSLATNPEGWAAFGHPEWGPFRLGKTNPNFSTSGLSALIAQTYAATGKTEDLSLEDLERPEVLDFARGVESAVVHYGDTTLTFLDNMYRADSEGTALRYASAVAVEEKSVLDYNSGNPNGVLEPGEQPEPPRIPLVAVYPKEGTLYSDNPLYVLDAEWVRDEEREVAEAFVTFLQESPNQERVLEFGFRPANPAVPIGEPVVAANGLDPDQPQTLLDVPGPSVMNGLLEQWEQVRKRARALIVMDVSGSMKEPAGSGTRQTKLDLAKEAAISSLDQFAPTDEVGLRAFTTDIDGRGASYLDLVPIGEVGQNETELVGAIEGLVPASGTPLYEVTATSVEDVLAGYDATRINAVVLLTDGRNDDGTPGDDEAQLEELLSFLTDSTQGENGVPVRLFTIGYGEDADELVLTQLAEATNAASYDARDPRTIEQVFASVISNF